MSSESSSMRRCRTALVAPALIALTLAAGCGDDAVNLDVVIAPTATESPVVLVLEPKAATLSTLYGDVVLRTYALSFEEDSLAVERLVAKLAKQSDRMARIERVYVMAAEGRLSDIELKIITEETRLPAEQVQRYIPHEMILVASDGTRLYIKTGVETESVSRRSRFREWLRSTWSGISGHGELHMQLSPDDAMSLYGVARGGPHLIVR